MVENFHEGSHPQISTRYLPLGVLEESGGRQKLSKKGQDLSKRKEILSWVHSWDIAVYFAKENYLTKFKHKGTT